MPPSHNVTLPGLFEAGIQTSWLVIHSLSGRCCGMIDAFFFASRGRHTSLTCDWSSDVCYSDLEPAFREAIRIRPDYAEAHSNLASVLASAGRFDEARYNFELAIRLKPDFAAARFNY